LPVAVNAKYSLNATIGIPTTTITTVLFDTKSYDTHSAYNTSTGIYTVPVSGKYSVSASFFTGNQDSNASCQLYFTVNGT
jgi:hypothetical protein